MKPIILTEDQKTTLRYIRKNGVVTDTDRPAQLDKQPYNAALFELMDGGFISATPSSLGSGYEIRLTPRAHIYEKVHPNFELSDKVRREYALKGALHLAAMAAIAILLIIFIIVK